jgi:hypothetical protein
MNEILRLCRDELSKFPTTLEDDLKRLECQEIDLDERFMLYLTSGIKRILCAQINFASKFN